MSHAFGLLIESLVAVLLLLTIGYCFVLNARLKRLRADEQSLKATIAELVMATGIAERAVSGLRATAQDCEATLGSKLAAAERCATELSREVKAGEDLLDRVSRIVGATRSVAAPRLPATAPAQPSLPLAPDPKAVAAAAAAFAKRTRSRASTRAA